MTTEIITLLANLALALSFIVALVFGIAQVRAAARDRRERLTLETLRSFQTREFAELMVYINSHNPPTRYEDWMALLKMIRLSNFSFHRKRNCLAFFLQNG